jgi:hypothetical protein
MPRYDRRPKPKREYVPPATNTMMRADPRDITQGADGWSVVQTKDAKKVQRICKFADKHIPRPPPAPRRPDNLDRLHIRQDRHQFVPPLIFVRADPRDQTSSTIIRAANKCLRLHNNRSFQRFANSLSILTLDRPS